jgi:phi13 family phage major tail protein
MKVMPVKPKETEKTKAAPVIGVDMAHYAVLAKDLSPSEEGFGPPEYGDPVALIGAKAIRISSGDNTDTFFYDNVPMFTATAKGEKTVSFVRAEFTNPERRALLGLGVDDDGATVEDADANPPTIAFGFRRKLIGGAYEYVWYLKGTMGMNEENTDSQEKNVSIQDRTMVGTFVPRQCDRMYVRRVSTNDPDVKTDLIKNWFKKETIAKILKAVDGGTAPAAPAG